ncbi:MAG: class I SAM-dependent rRNA methyltransferase [Planctomycetes bacterium]|nr:class I SAM-dependent rRNA methyltransferase [Planctomycetota bacterium]
MSLVRSHASILPLRLNRDLARTIKRGHPWVYADALRDLPRAPAGTPAVLLDNRKGQPVAIGFYDPDSPLAFRVCDTDGLAKLDQRWAEQRLRAAVTWRKSLFDQDTTGYRLLNGEGDSTPGLVVDVYGETAVLKLDGAGPIGFWDAPGIAEWIADTLAVKCVYERRKERGREGRVLVGDEPSQPVSFLENGLQFTADVIRGQKTGFFLDQRDNRLSIRNLARGRTVLNVFAYTGGFSVAAGVGGATHVTTVDLAQPAIEASCTHWLQNQLSDTGHEAMATDAFQFLTDAAARRQRWDITIVDPPSFAPNQESVPKASSAYQSLIAAGARVTSRGGLLAAASCSSHIDLPLFLSLCEEGVSEARRRGTVLAIQGQPPDHPTPLALPEFRYLKFVLLRMD